MTNEELCALAKSGDRDAQNAIIKNNRGFVYQIAYESMNRNLDRNISAGVEMDDLVQVGCLGLFLAINKYNPATGNKFLTYAAPAVKRNILDLIDAAKNSFEMRLQDKDDLGMERVGLFDTVFIDEKTQRIEVMANPFVKTPEQLYIEAETRMEIHEALRNIAPREQHYIVYRFGFDEEDEERPFSRTAEHFNLSESRARGIEDAALKHVRRKLPW